MAPHVHRNARLGPQVLINDTWYKYETRQARSAGEGRFVRQHLPQIAPKHLRLINKWREDQYNGLTDKEKETFGKLFRQYSRDAVRQALGSAPQDTGSYSMG